MELGERLKQARLEAGLSQRQLCGEVITRNMLSLIENGNAKPSMDTLKLLSARLGKPVSYFLEEDALTSPNAEVMEEARMRFDSGDHAGVLRALENFRQPDRIYEREKTLLETLCNLELAEQAIAQARYPYALELLKKAEVETFCCQEEITRRRLLLLGSLPGQRVSHQLPSLDEELLLRAGEALEEGDPERARCLLDAVQEQGSTRWNLLRGRTDLKRGRFRDAARRLRNAEKDYPREVIPLLEECYRELKDYKRAYEYACKHR